MTQTITPADTLAQTSMRAVVPDYAAPLPAVDDLRVTLAERGYTITAGLFVDPGHPTLRGHFPGLPLYPGVFIVETLCQVMTQALPRRLWLRSVQSLRLTAALHGGDQLTLTVEVSAKGDGKHDVWAVKATGRRRDGATAATIRATFSGAPAGLTTMPATEPASAIGSGLMNAAQIQAALPQRHPLLLVDQVLSLDPGRVIETGKAVTASDPCYAGVPAGAPIDAYAYPVSLLIESFGQSAALLWLGDAAGRDDGSVLLFVGARDYQVEGYAYPGDVVRNVVRLEQVVAETAFATGESWAGDRLIARVGSLMAARRSREAVGTTTSNEEDRYVTV